MEFSASFSDVVLLDTGFIPGYVSDGMAHRAACTFDNGLEFSGRHFGSEEIRLILDIAGDFPALSLTELASTVCELLDWKASEWEAEVMFSDLCWYEFQRAGETVTFPIQLSPLQKQLLDLLEIDLSVYA